MDKISLSHTLSITLSHPLSLSIIVCIPPLQTKLVCIVGWPRVHDNKKNARDDICIIFISSFFCQRSFRIKIPDDHIQLAK